MSAKVSIAVVLDGPPTPAWQARVVETLDASEAVAVDGLRLLEDTPRRGLAHRLRIALERRVFAIGSDPQRPVELAPRDCSRPPALELWLAERAAPVDRTSGVVSLRHGDFLESAEAAFCRALLTGASCVESELLLSREGNSGVIARTVSEVRPFSETLSRTLALWKLADMVPRSLERLLGTSPEPAGYEAAGELTPPRPVASDVVLLARAATRALRALLIRAWFHRPWSILVGRESTSTPIARQAFDDGLVRWADARMYADPFLFEHDGRHHLFCEEVPKGEKHGVISHTELRLDGGAAAAPRPVLRAEHHLSYPFVFAHEGEVFMIPETSAARRVELYRASVFPDAWEREAVLLEDLNAADATLLAHGGLLWLFASVAAPGASSLDELHLFWAEALRGPWHSHPLNPIVSDVRCARPAGAIQRWDSRLVRPAQDCSRRYGWAISFRQIDLLSTTAYAEHELDRVEPSALKGARATHTYASDGRFVALDIRRREPRVRRRLGFAGAARHETEGHPTGGEPASPR